MLLGRATVISHEVLAAAKQAKTLFHRNSPAFQQAVSSTFAGLDAESVKATEDAVFRRAANGTGFWRCALSTNMNELRFLMCPYAEESATLREFFSKNYNDLKYHNPLLPMLVREHVNFEPKLVARFDYAYEVVVPVSGFTTPMLWETLFYFNHLGKGQRRSPESLPIDNDWIVNKPIVSVKISNPPISE
eukprot:c32507_g1_i1.p1 GENE.c32507_g1_i1~~c32507_g1_i1.p1  ORF type:complete len:212 (-),score=27.25 c32507_g1_i1:419-988(-)